MTHSTFLSLASTLGRKFQERAGRITTAPPIRDVAFPLPGGIDGAAKAFAGDIEADIYARPHNPTVRTLTDTINKLEGGTGAVAYSSGQAAIRNVLQILTEKDTEVILSHHIFGGTIALQGAIFSRFGITFKWADPSDPASFESLITDKTRAFFVESVANPASEIADFKGISAVAKAHKIPFIVDNTTAPLLLRPIDVGADVVVYSATKYLNGHGNAIAGIAVDGGKFDWQGDKRFPVLSAANGTIPSLAKRFNERALFKGLQSQLTVDGAILSPDSALAIHRNLPTLPERLAGHIKNTMAVSEFLQSHPAIEAVHYAGLADHSSHDRARQYLPDGVAGPILVTFKGGREHAAAFVDHLDQTFTHAVNIGDAYQSLVSHPATTTHRQLSRTQAERIGIKDGSLRLSIAAYDQDRIIGSLDRALQAVPS